MHTMHQKMYLKALVLFLLAWITTACQQQPPQNPSKMKPIFQKNTMAFRLTGNVYPDGYYAVSILIGNETHTKSYVLDIDTGSDLTWINCDFGKINSRYNFVDGEYVNCSDPECTALGELRNMTDAHINCTGMSAEHPCGYKADYADNFSTTGFLVRNFVHLRLLIGKWVIPRLTFGCGEYNETLHQLSKGRMVSNDGMLGLGKGEAGFLSQLHKMGIIENVVGHCLSSGEDGGGYLFLGDIRFGETVWKRLDISDNHYNLGRAYIMFNDTETDIKNLQVIFDSGSTYTYLESQAYLALLDLITKHLDPQYLTHNPDDPTLSMCWKGNTHFETVSEVAGYFQNLALIFPLEEHVKFQMPPTSYLIISETGNVCLGILDGGQVGLEDMNVIGDISMHDKVVIYDNKNGKVGWADANCNLKKSHL